MANAGTRKAGYQYWHVGVDDHNQLADAVLLPDRTTVAVAVLERSHWASSPGRSNVR